MYDARKDNGMTGMTNRMTLGVVFLLISMAAQAGEVIGLPEGAKAEVTFRTEKDKGPKVLFDNNPKTFMTAGGGTCNNPTDQTSLLIRFKEPLENLGGIVTGESDKFHNYYPEVFEFWVDSNGDGRFDTMTGRTDKLGPAEQCKGTHKFDGRLPKAYGLEVRCVRQHVGGGKRAWTMNEMKLVLDPSLPVLKATPNAHRVTYFTDPMPKGCTAKLTFATEKDKGAELLLDGNVNSAYAAKQGTAKEGKAESIFLRFPEPVKDLAGLILGRSDKYGNYVWKTMEFHVDTNGDGKYDTFAGKTPGSGGGEKRFKEPVDTAHGVELRVTDQTVKGTRRAFVLSEISGLVLCDSLGDSQMKYVVEDFEDFTTWRTWATHTGQPEGERYFGGYVFLSGKHDPALAKRGQGVGVYRYNFKGDKGPYRAWATRADVRHQEGVMDKITFWANPQGYDCEVWFEINDSKNKKAQTPHVKLSGNEWKQYEISVTPREMTAAGSMQAPLGIGMMFLLGSRPGQGDVLIDDIAFEGAVSRRMRVKIRPVYHGICYEPGSPVQPKYIVSNSLDKPVNLPLEAKLYSSFDPKRKNPIVEKTIALRLEAYGTQDVTLDLGTLPYGHYEAVLTVKGEGIDVTERDLVPVMRLNGGRVNKTPMWFGSMHHGHWTAAIENEFILNNIVVPLGIDCYRTGAPDKSLVDAGLLCNAGFGGMPKHLRKEGQKGDDRGEPNDYDAYYEWCKQEAREKYLPRKDAIISIEFYNEPDLPKFCYLPEIDTFDKMHKVFAKAFREVIPGVRIGTGGNTVQHGKEKEDFNRRTYMEIAASGQADVAIWHAHGPLENYKTRHRMVEKWLEKGGLPKEKWLLGNSEAAVPSGQGSAGRLNQADNLVKKIGWARSQKNSLFYSWFVTTDLFDAQHRHGGEDWGLVTIGKRVKPSGQAYNELIRRLANTVGHGEVDFGPRVGATHYTKSDGSKLWLVWPNEQGASFLLPLSATGPVQTCDMFGGNEKVLTPKNGKITLMLNGYPMYLGAKSDVEVTMPSAIGYATYPETVGVSPGSDAAYTATFKNTWGKPVTLAVTLEDMAGTRIAEKTVSLAAEGKAEESFLFALPEGATFGTIGYVMKISSAEAGLEEDVLPVSVVIAEQMPNVDGSFTVDGAPDKLAKKGVVVVDKKEDTHDLVYDPNTPFWANKDDLSIKLTMAHNTKEMYFCFEVRDQSHNPGKPGVGLWAKDSIQLGFVLQNKQFEVGMTEADGGSGWCWIHPDPEKKGKLTVPHKATRKDGVTVYEMTIPFAWLGVEYAPNMAGRITFLANEDDGRNRVRIMKYFDGIASGKNIEKFGHMVIE